jgi:hypothetical protein
LADGAPVAVAGAHLKTDGGLTGLRLESIQPADFENFKGGYQGQGLQYMTGSVSLTKLKELSQHEEVSVILAPELNLSVVRKLEEKELLSA